MNRIFAILLLSALPALCQTYCMVTGHLSRANSQPWTNAVLTFTAQSTPLTEPPLLVSGQTITTTSRAPVGHFTINLEHGIYRVQIGSLPRDTFTITIPPDVNETNHIQTYITSGATTNFVPGDASGWTKSASDSRYVKLTNGVAYKPVLSNNTATIGWVWTATNAQGAGHWAVSSGVAGTPGGGNFMAQWNDAGTLAGLSNLIYYPGTGEMVLSNHIGTGQVRFRGPVIAHSTVDIGADGVRISSSADGNITLGSLGAIDGQNLNFNFDAGPDRIEVTSPSGAQSIHCQGIDLAIRYLEDSAGGSPAGVGFIRMTNGSFVAWEASPAGTDITLSVNSSEQFVFSEPIFSPRLADFVWTNSGASDASLGISISNLVLKAENGLSVAGVSNAHVGTVTFSAPDLVGATNGLDSRLTTASNALQVASSNNVRVTAGANVTVTPSGSGGIMTYEVASSASATIGPGALDFNLNQFNTNGMVSIKTGSFQTNNFFFGIISNNASVYLTDGDLTQSGGDFSSDGSYRILGDGFVGGSLSVTGLFTLRGGFSIPPMPGSATIDVTTNQVFYFTVAVSTNITIAGLTSNHVALLVFTQPSGGGQTVSIAGVGELFGVNTNASARTFVSVNGFGGTTNATAEAPGVYMTSYLAKGDILASDGTNFVKVNLGTGKIAMGTNANHVSGVAAVDIPSGGAGEANVNGEISVTNATTVGLVYGKDSITNLLRSLRGGSNITLTNEGTNIMIAASAIGGGETNWTRTGTTLHPTIKPDTVIVPEILQASNVIGSNFVMTAGATAQMSQNTGKSYALTLTNASGQVGYSPMWPDLSIGRMSWIVPGHTSPGSSGHGEQWALIGGNFSFTEASATLPPAFFFLVSGTAATTNALRASNFKFWYPGKGTGIDWRSGFYPGTTNAVRNFFGLTDGSDTQMGTALPNRDFAMFRYDHTMDGTYKFITCNSGSAWTSNDTGIAYSPLVHHHFRIKEDVAASTWYAFIDGVPVATNTANIPAGAAMQSMSILFTYENASKTNYHSYIQCNQPF